MLKFESSLTKSQFIRLSILRHIQRNTFYFYAFTCAVVTAYVLIQDESRIFLLIVWLPFLLYILLGLINAFQLSSDKDTPYLLPTKYEFSVEGVKLRNRKGKSQLEWSDFATWKKMVGCYVLILQNGAIIPIPESALASSSAKQFEQLLTQYLH